MKRCYLAMFVVAGVMAFSGAQAATTLSLQAAPAPGIQQNAQGPCVIGDPSCVSNPLLPEGFTTLPSGGPGSYTDIMSPGYLVSNLRSFLASDLFTIQIDVNQANGQATQTLSKFQMSQVGGGVLAEYLAPGGTAIPPVNSPGNGFSDYFLSGFSLAGLLDTDVVKFTMSMPVKNGGREQFFLQSVTGTGPNPGTSPVPLPAAVWLLGAGVASLGVARRRRG